MRGRKHVRRPAAKPAGMQGATRVVRPGEKTVAKIGARTAATIAGMTTGPRANSAAGSAMPGVRHDK